MKDRAEPSGRSGEEVAGCVVLRGLAGLLLSLCAAGSEAR